MDLTDIETLHPNTKEYTFSAPHETVSHTDHILGHKVSFNRYKEIEITSPILSEHLGLMLGINNSNN